MKCPYCGYQEDKVIDSRSSRDGEAVRRRRECLKCSKRFTTYEEVEYNLPLVVKKDGGRENFDSKKILSGIKKACEKRPISIEAMDRIVDGIEKSLQSSIEREVNSASIGEMIMEKLKTLDDVAYVRFASVYRSFKDINEFKKIVNKLIEK